MPVLSSKKEFIKPIKLSDFVDEESGFTRWEDYNLALIGNGEQCTKCQIILLVPTGYPVLCPTCATTNQKNYLKMSLEARVIEIESKQREMLEEIKELNKLLYDYFCDCKHCK